MIRLGALLSVLLVLGVWGVPGARADTGLVGEWHMDAVTAGTTPDSSGNGNALQVSGPTQVAGRWGQAFAFTGAQNDALSTTTAVLQPPQVTVMAWVRASSSPGDYRAIVSQGGDPSCNVASYSLYTGANGGLSFYVAKDVSTTVNSPSIPPSTIWDGQWHAVAGVYDGTSVRLYLDGSQFGSATASNGTAIDYGVPDDVFEVGDFHACTGFEYTGAIDEVRVYDRALGAAELAELQAPSATSPPEIGADPTSTAVNCMPGTTAVGAPVTCTATVTDTAQAPEAAPSGSVAFMSDSTGAFSAPGANCTLTPGVGTQSSCQVTYTPSAVGSGLHTISAGYTSDASDGASFGTAQVGVTAGSTGSTGTTGSTGFTGPTGTTGTTGAPPPRASFTGPATAVHTATLTTLDAGATTGATLLDWSVNGVPTASCSAQTPDVSLLLKPTSAVTLTALGPGGSSSTTQTFTAVYKKPAPSNGRSFLSTTVCSGGSSLVDVTAGGGPPAGCTTAVTEGLISAVGCFSSVTDPTQVPTGEAAILTSLETDYQSDGSFQAAAGWFCQNIASCSGLGTRGTLGPVGSTTRFTTIRIVIQTAGLYVSRSTVRINGVDFTPLAGAAIVISPGFGRVVSSDAEVRVGGVPIKVGSINLDVADHCTPSCGNGTIPIASFDSRGLPDAGDFPFSGQASISFVAAGTDHYSTIGGQVTLPPVLGSATVSGTLRADNANGITLQNFHAHLDSLGYEGIGLTDVDIYFQTPGDWAFYGNIGIGTAVIRLVPTTEEPLNGVVFVNGSLDHAGATLDLTDDPPEIAPGVQLDTISLSFALNPTALRGSVTLNALGVADVTGNMVLAFPSPNAPFKVLPGDLPGAPQTVLDQSYTQSPVIGVGGQVAIVVPDVGDLPLGSGYLLYAYPGYVAAGGQIDHDFFDVLKFDGGVNGEFNVVNKRFNLSGHVEICLEDLGCAEVDAVVSSYGVGACFGDEGGGFRWHDFPTPHIDITVFGVGSSCDISSFSETHVFAAGDASVAHAAAATVHAVTLRRDQKPYVIRLDGAGGAPNVSVTGPGGQSLTGTAAGIHRSGGIIIVQSEMSTETVVGIKPTVPGRYTVTLLDGPAVTHSYKEIQQAPAQVTGQVTGSGPHRLLHYRVDAPGEQVTFLQVAHGVSREIGTASGRTGTLRFTTEPGSNARTIEATLSASDGIPSAGAKPIVVARSRGPRFVRPGRVTHLAARWRGAILTVNWHAATAAVSYVVTVHERGGARTRITTRAHALRVPALHPTLKGSVTVTAISADGSRGAEASTSYRAAHAPASRFLPFSELKAKPRKHN